MTMLVDLDVVLRAARFRLSMSVGAAARIS